MILQLPLRKPKKTEARQILFCFFQASLPRSVLQHSSRMSLTVRGPWRTTKTDWLIILTVSPPAPSVHSQIGCRREVELRTVHETFFFVLPQPSHSHPTKGPRPLTSSCHRYLPANTTWIISYKSYIHYVIIVDNHHSPLQFKNSLFISLFILFLILQTSGPGRNSLKYITTPRIAYHHRSYIHKVI